MLKATTKKLAAKDAKKTIPRSPPKSSTEKQIALAEQLREQIKKRGVAEVNIKQAMLQAGYSHTYIRSYKYKGKGVQKIHAILDAVFPDDELARLQLKQLSASKIKTVEFPVELLDGDIEYACEDLGFRVIRISTAHGKKCAMCAMPDWDAINKGLERIWRLKKHLDPSEGAKDPQVTVLAIFQSLAERNAKYLPDEQSQPIEGEAVSTRKSE